MKHTQTGDTMSNLCEMRDCASPLMLLLSHFFICRYLSDTKNTSIQGVQWNERSITSPCWEGTTQCKKMRKSEKTILHQIYTQTVYFDCELFNGQHVVHSVATIVRLSAWCRQASRCCMLVRDRTVLSIATQRFKRQTKNVSFLPRLLTVSF